MQLLTSYIQDPLHPPALHLKADLFSTLGLRGIFSSLSLEYLNGQIRSLDVDHLSPLKSSHLEYNSRGISVEYVLFPLSELIGFSLINPAQYFKGPPSQQSDRSSISSHPSGGFNQL
jgi:hypothetical protein